MNPKHELELKEKNIRHLLIENEKVIVNEHYMGHPWSLVKLVLLGQWSWIYTAMTNKKVN